MPESTDGMMSGSVMVRKTVTGDAPRFLPASSRVGSTLVRPARTVMNGYGSAMTLGYTVGAALLWGAGIERTVSLTAAGALDPALLPLALAWTIGVTAYLLWHFLGGRDERRLLAELRAMYPDAVRSRNGARRTR